ncbi:hypothetical protein [Halopseudomonas bauzanensis]|uniref:hypothetical protein n=1 Tax=Halopseudomonas bauzanensis TaxID=653930 RepID=UPI00115FDFE9|nr:hypothetical protein [Halopseudomonas bauzanensis]
MMSLIHYLSAVTIGAIHETSLGWKWRWLTTLRCVKPPLIIGDIHSPRVPQVAEMLRLLRKAAKLFHQPAPPVC